MSTNPNNAVGTNAAYGGRTSVNAFNDNLATYTTGIVSGWECSPDSGLTVVLGGNGNTRDVAIAEDNSGNKTTINNISGTPISVTMDAAPGSNSRIDLVVAYVDNPPQGTSTTADNPGACGIINVTGTASSTPIAPNDSAIRSAITADGASGTTAYYVILAEITIVSGTTDLTSDDIAPGDIAKLNGTGVVSSQNIDFTTMKRWLPDYSNATSILVSNKTSYTMDADGFINVGLYRYDNPASTDVTIAITINSKTVGYVGSGAVAVNGAKVVTYTNMFPVLAGDIVTVNFSSDTAVLSRIYFMPGKWA